MSAATDFLSEWVTKAGIRLPSITMSTGQRWPGVGIPPNFRPGIASYGWGINGVVTKDGAGTPNGLHFGLEVWFSDRGLDLSNAPPTCGQQFQADQADSEQFTFTLAGDAVDLRIQVPKWGIDYTVSTTTLDEPSQQLIFSVPGAGPNAPQALMLVSFGDTGQFNWID
jgi:hypothetical protein